MISYHILYDIEFHCKIFKTFKSLICNFFPKFPQKNHGISNPGFEGFGIAEKFSQKPPL